MFCAGRSRHLNAVYVVMASSPAGLVSDAGIVGLPQPRAPFEAIGGDDHDRTAKVVDCKEPMHHSSAARLSCDHHEVESEGVSSDHGKRGDFPLFKPH